MTAHYDGSENEALVAAASRLGATKAGHLFGRLGRENMRGFHAACVQLLAALIRSLPSRPNGEWRMALGDLSAAAIVETSPALARKPTMPDHAAMVAALLHSLDVLEARTLREAAGAAIAASASAFHPGRVIVHALATLIVQRGESASSDAVFARL